MKHGWTPESKQRLWAWYEKASNWEGGYSFQGYLDIMIQELVALLDPQEKEQFLSRGDQFPFPTRILVRTIDLGSEPRWLKALASLFGRLQSDKLTAMQSELRGLIIDKLGRSDRPEVHATLRDLYRREPSQRDAIARAIAGHPDEEDLPILVAALDSRRPQYDQPGPSRTGQAQVHSRRARGARKPDSPGPSGRPEHVHNAQ